MLSMEILAVLGDIPLNLLSLRSMSSCIKCRFAARLSKRGHEVGRYGALAFDTGRLS